MNILIISRGYPSENYKTNGIFEFDQAKALVEAGHNVIYAAIDMRSFRRKRKIGFESKKKDGVQIEAINIPCGRIPKYILNAIRIYAFKKIYKRIENRYGQPDIIHAHFIEFGYITVKGIQHNKIPVVLTEHYSGMNQDKINSYLTKMGFYTYEKMDKLIAVSSYLASNIKKKFNVESIVIPNIVDTSSFNFNITEKEEDLFYFLSTGNLLENKRMDNLILAFNNAFKENKKVNLYIYGDGPEHNKLKNMILQYGLLDRVFLMGQVDRKEIANKMSESDCFVLASRLETFGVAYIEAMAMGLPVISTKCGGPEEFITEKNGVLVTVDDVNELAKVLINVYENSSNFDRIGISNSTKIKFSSQTIAKQLEEVYANIIHKKNKEMKKLC